ncbi:MAG TPA: hypothetical protein VHC49_00765 [Mycobacteriales bacterium]|nr:hypothetical protein [Mycobacteriales bacterium]
MRRIEQYAPEDADALRATVGDHSRAGCAGALAAAADLYRRLRPGATVPRIAAEREALAYLAAVQAS